jgi:hypothetical protein
MMLEEAHGYQNYDCIKSKIKREQDQKCGAARAVVPYLHFRGGEKCEVVKRKTPPQGLITPLEILS